MPQLDATSQKGYYLVIYIKYLQKYMVFFRNYWSHGTKILCVWKASGINNDADAKRVQIFRRAHGNVNNARWTCTKSVFPKCV